MAKIALLIGVSEYEPELNPLPAAVKDIKAMQRVLQHPDIGGFAEADIKILENPQRQVMEEAIETLFSERNKDDMVLLYFSGHGIKDDRGRLFLTTSETRKNSKGELIRATATAASKIHEDMENSRSRQQVIILDCCFSGAFATGMSAKDDDNLDIKKQLVETNKPEEVQGRVVITSSTATQYSFEQQGSELSIYTHYLVEGIEKGTADTDNDGVISVDELHEYARKKVQEAASAMKPGIFAVMQGYKIQLAKAPKSNSKLIKQHSDNDDLSSKKQVDYRHLRDLLKAGKWKQADQETLVVMLEAADRVQKGRLSGKSIENFPCTDLRTLDQLWVKYSNGHFGFSVQKRIWERVGKDLEKFIDRVGWLQTGMFKSEYRRSYDEYSFTINAPKGHLPAAYSIKTEKTAISLIKAVYPMPLVVASTLGLYDLDSAIKSERLNETLFFRIEACEL
ncbi:caspase, EACC1-associated type [Nostoc sp. FACHB-145]|uniref:caspase, EACC1-associated type n=1 Tax=Nostoc sp. FACHB-145 TaxID=2692836 RepID=UPI001F5568F8|nr:GUN4 domain-containing protein [Nostoc sp. FACHB-145]